MRGSIWTSRSGRRKRGSPHLLVLAQANDHTAGQFAEFVRRMGGSVTVAELTDLQLAIASTRDGDVTVSIARDGEGMTVDAILNRALVHHGSDRDTRFRAAEELAAWWAALVAFPGKVANRPSARGFLPELDATVLARRASLPLARRVLATVSPGAGPANVHRFHDGSHVGFFWDLANLPRVSGEVLRYTFFDPARIVSAIVSGERLIVLGAHDPRLDEPLERLRVAILDEGVNHAFLVVECSDSPVLIHASGFPGSSQYLGYEAPVHQALLEFLSSP